MRIMILSVPHERTPNQESVSDTQIEQIKSILNSNGFKAEAFEYSPTTLSDNISSWSPTLIFNLVYGFYSIDGNYRELQHESTKRIETVFKRLVGSSHKVQAIAQDKRQTALSTSAVVESPREISHQALKIAGIGIIKPRYGGCHRGVKLVRSPADCGGAQLSDSEECLLQEYIEGPEYTVGVVERGQDLHVFTPVEICFKTTAGGEEQIMDWDLYKWKLARRLGAPECLARAARLVFRELKMRDYARFDFRMRNDSAVLLDANALPNLDPSISLLPYMARMDSSSYEDLILTIVKSALLRTT
jgi:hypothetical protein